MRQAIIRFGERKLGVSIPTVSADPTGAELADPYFDASEHRGLQHEQEHDRRSWWLDVAKVTIGDLVKRATGFYQGHAVQVSRAEDLVESTQERSER